MKLSNNFYTMDMFQCGKHNKRKAIVYQCFFLSTQYFHADDATILQQKKTSNINFIGNKLLQSYYYILILPTLLFSSELYMMACPYLYYLSVGT